MKREYPEGCRLCEKGAKMVLFVTGMCSKSCYFCPLSERRKGLDSMWANERLVKNNDGILEEAERMKAEGVGITGGDPALRMWRTLESMALLKSNFGSGFHMHLYTAMPLSGEQIKNLIEGGLDEIRFHLAGYPGAADNLIWKSIDRSVRYGLETGIEIPAIPGRSSDILSIARKLRDVGGTFLNLNELEFSETNVEAMTGHGHEFKDGLSYAVMGSEEAAEKVMQEMPDMHINYCSSRFKDAVQLKNRLIRTAHNIAKEYEEITEDGLLLKGIAEPEKNHQTGLDSLRQTLLQRFDIPEGMIRVDAEKQRLETSQEIAYFLSDAHPRKTIRYYLIEEYPTADRLETTRTEIK